MSAATHDTARPGVFRTAARAWRSAVSALLQMPLAFLLTIAAVVLVRLALSVPWFAVPLVSRNHPVPAPSLAVTGHVVLVTVLGTILNALVLAPLAIAVHRHVLLGERTALLPLRPLRRLLRFADWLIVLGLAGDLPGLLGLLPLPGAPLIGFVAMIVVLVVTIRLVLVFPAIAVQPPTARASLGWRETYGQVWRIAAVLLVSTLPILGLALLVLLLGPRLSPGTTMQMIAISPLTAALDPFGTALGAAAASWLFLAYHGPHTPPRDPTATA